MSRKCKIHGFTLYNNRCSACGLNKIKSFRKPSIIVKQKIFRPKKKYFKLPKQQVFIVKKAEVELILENPKEESSNDSIQTLIDALS